MFDYGTRTPGLLETASIAASQLWTITRTSVEGLYYMIVGQISTCNLSSPIGIAEASVAKASDGLVEFIWFLGVISVAIGFLNLFPIPPLDGGHLMFHAYEAVARRPRQRSGRARANDAGHGAGVDLVPVCVVQRPDLLSGRRP